MFRNFVLTISAILTLALVSYAQLSLPGEVVEVIDGRTVVVVTSSGKVSVELQYIDVPDPAQALNSTVKDHLINLVLGKRVEYRPRILSNGRVIGRLTVNNIDVSQQMLRDGAAWHLPARVSGQEKNEYDIYAALENTAKTEKRGVWSVSTLRPSWEVRAGRLEDEKRTAQNLYASNVSPRLPAARRAGMWSDKNPRLPNVGALLNGYNAKTKTGYIGTSLLGITEMEADKLKLHKTAFDIMYYYKEDDRKGRTGYFVVNLLSEAGKWRFLEKNDLVLVVNDKIDLVIGKAKRTTVNDGLTMREHLAYEVDRSAIDKIVNSGEVGLKVGDYLIRPSHGLQQLLYNLLQASE